MTRRNVPGRKKDRMVHDAAGEGTLGCRFKSSYGDQSISVKFQSKRFLVKGGEEIDDCPSHTEIPPLLHDPLRKVALLLQEIDQSFPHHFFPNGERKG